MDILVCVEANILLCLRLEPCLLYRHFVVAWVQYQETVLSRSIGLCCSRCRCCYIRCGHGCFWNNGTGGISNRSVNGSIYCLPEDGGREGKEHQHPEANSA